MILEEEIQRIDAVVRFCKTIFAGHRCRNEPVHVDIPAPYYYLGLFDSREEAAAVAARKRSELEALRSECDNVDWRTE